MSIGCFYNKFERHAHAEGLKRNSTHYCPGCGHGIVHKYLAEAIDELKIQDKTIAISPVGCSVFLYYYLDVGNTQAAHGRASVVAVGQKLANPKSIVLCYQGDGDLASIGLAEIVHTAQTGVPITVIFVNNAIYGMTGGQMAPTTLMGQKTATCPSGRDDSMGKPLKMAEMIAQLDAPVYVERVALYNNKERTRAKKAIKKGIQIQIGNKGFSFIEVLSECPTHLKLSGTECNKWVQDNMVPVFPPGVLKDTASKPRFKPIFPSFDPKRIIDVITGGGQKSATRHAKSFPYHLGKKDIALKFAGAGGDGAQTAALLLTRASINEGFDSTHIPSYGPESRGGTSYADVHIAKDEVLSPAAPDPNILIAFNAPSLSKFGPNVIPGGTIIYDSSVVLEPTVFKKTKQYGIPFTEIAGNLGNIVVKNIVALGSLHAATNLFERKTFLTAIRIALESKSDLIPINEKAFSLGIKAVEEHA